jgi:heme/copper-type cytochrome/quinol oxidase subunit 3
MIDGFLGANHGKYNPHDEDGHVIKKESHFPLLHVAREDIKFESVFSPKMNNYYGIYFTITGIHGLHVIGGALVLAYYLFFGRKMYLTNPEWLANRVEVGGLFWHFVDLVWIFAFPIFYLM